MAKKHINSGEELKQKIKLLKQQQPNRWSALPSTVIKESTVTTPKVNSELDKDEYEIELVDSDSLKNSDIIKIKTYFKYENE